MLNRLILAVIGFIAGACVMAMKYDHALSNSNRFVETPAMEAGLPIEVAWGLKLIWTIVFILLTGACVIIPPASEKK